MVKLEKNNANGKKIPVENSNFCHMNVCQSRKIQLSIGPHLYVVQKLQ